MFTTTGKSGPRQSLITYQ